ncbi:hypothetical protein [Kluyvera sichuanensis]|uniref:hypothetical protein n=1 Tax=Kluyvera sichuanensis TaxID=2725494 RepID=UPI002FD62E17
MLEHLLKVVEEVHPLRSFLKIVYNIATGIPAEFGKKAYSSWQQEKYQHSCLCFGLAIVYIACLVGVVFLLAPWFKALVIAKFAVSPTLACFLTAGCKTLLRKGVEKTFAALGKRIL